ncbi:MAG: M56 family metallopeptidase, partial [Akkermansiaceae bacterium]|nr:M56 family metallopeptidase [Armatimonadota bacterium]
MGSDLLSRLGAGCVGGTVAVLGAFLLFRLLPGLPGTVRYWVWWLVCLKMVFGVFVLPSLPLTVLPTTPATTLETVPPPAYAEATDAAVSGTTPSPSGATAGTEVSPAVAPEFSVTQLLIGLWLVGVGIGIGIQAMALAQLHRITAGAAREDSGLLTEAAERAGLRRVPELWIARSPVEPLTVGLLRPRILIGSDDKARLSPAELLTILTHECTHIKRNDLSLSLVPWLAQTLFWFLPPIYLALREFELAREAACDRQTIAALSLEPRAYGELLVKLSSSPSPVPVPSSAMALSAGFINLKRRIEMLPIRPCRRRLIVLASLLVAGLLVPWRLTSAAPAIQRGTLPNLDFAQGLTGWYKTAMGSDSIAHPYYEVGVEQSTAGGGERSGFVKARASAD